MTSLYLLVNVKPKCFLNPASHHRPRWATPVATGINFSSPLLPPYLAFPVILQLNHYNCKTTPFS